MSEQDLSDIIPEILDRLVGDISGHGDTASDREAQANMVNFEAVCLWVAGKLTDVERCVASPYFSMAKTGRMMLQAADELIYVIREEIPE